MSFISKVAAAAVLAISLAPAAGQAVGLQPFPKAPTPRFQTADEEAILKTAKVVAEDTLMYDVEYTSNVCGTTGKAGQNVKVLIRTSSGRLITIRTFGIPEDGIIFKSQATECK